MFNAPKKINKTAQQAPAAIPGVASLQRDEQRIDESSRDTSHAGDTSKRGRR